MFDSLSSSLQGVFKTLRGYGKLSEKNIKDAMREVRMALLEADVKFQVAKDFTKRVSDACMGEEVLDSVTPGQQVVKRVHDELVDLLGGSRAELAPAGRPASVMMIGLHGSGKTTTTSKLAARWKKEGKNVLLVACDIRRPAAVDQLGVLAENIGVDLVKPEAGETVPQIGKRALEQAKREWRDIVIFDTGGRFQIDDELVDELKDLRKAISPQEVLLVADAALGQESVNIAGSFHDALSLTGLILTKLDGDARGGAALSIHAVTGCPLVMVGTGEHVTDLEPFHPERMASRILGMGDVVSLVEKAEQLIDQDAMEAMHGKMKRNQFDFEDFLSQLKQMKKMGSMTSILNMLPGGNPMMDQMKGALQDGEKADQMETYSRQAEAIICSMTLKERRNPKLINGSRRKRIAAGSGTQVADVNDLLRKFQQTRKMMKKFSKMMPKMMRGG